MGFMSTTMLLKDMISFSSVAGMPISLNLFEPGRNSKSAAALL